MAAVLDTHAALWYLLEAKRLPGNVFSLIDGAAAKGTPTFISAISLIEIIYLVERNRVPADAFDILRMELEQSEPTFRIVPVDLGVAEALRNVPRAEVPEMPDRIIAATALYLGLPLVTRDRRIRASKIKTIW